MASVAWSVYCVHSVSCVDCVRRRLRAALIASVAWSVDGVGASISSAASLREMGHERDRRETGTRGTGGARGHKDGRREAEWMDYVVRPVQWF